MSARYTGTRVAVGRAAVVREVRAAASLMTTLRAPVTARGPWLTAVLNAGAVARPRVRPVAVVVEAHRDGRPGAAALLALRRRGLTTVVGLLGGSAEPLPGGRPTARLLARDEEAAGRLADGVHDLLATLRRPWSLELAGLPLGDPASRELAARLPTSVLGNVRSVRLVDEFDAFGSTSVVRSRDPRVLERWLPALLTAVDPRARAFLRATARLHAAIGELELAVAVGGGVLRAGLLTLVDGDDRWPWWGTGPGTRTEMGAPLVGLTAPARGWPAQSALSPGAAR
jgi:hypothetical protein